MENCIFCKIINKEIPSTIVYEDEHVIAFEDINPQAPVHVLIVPKKHFANIVEFSNADCELSKAVLESFEKVAKIKKVNEEGFRIINNCGENAGQTVMHVHFHLIAGRVLGEKII